MFFTGCLENYPSGRLSSLKQLSMNLTLSTEWSKSQLSAPCFSCPPAQITFLAALIRIFRIRIPSILWLHPVSQTLLSPSKQHPMLPLCRVLSHTGRLLFPLDSWQIPLTCRTFLHPSPLSDCKAATLLPLFGAVLVLHQGPLWGSIATFASTIPNNYPYSCYSSHCPSS